MKAQPKKPSHKVYHLLQFDCEERHDLIVLKNETYSIGRDASNSIVLNFPSVSRQHAILLRVLVTDSEQHWFRLVDGSLKGKKSTNGIFVNEQRKSSYILQNGDRIRFGGTIEAIYHSFSSTKVLNTAQAIKSAFYALQDNQMVTDSTVIVPKFEETGNDDQASLLRLASFPELNPNPIIEIDFSGNITYLNPRATALFPDVRELKNKHPILAGIKLQKEQSSEPKVVREIAYGGSFFEEAIHYITESELIRIYLFDVTDKKAAEVALLARDRLLEAVAEAAQSLLLNFNLQMAVQSALQIIGFAIDVDCVFVAQVKLVRGSSDRCLDIRYRECLTPSGLTIHLDLWQQQPCQNTVIIDWLDHLAAGSAVRATLGAPEQMSAQTRELLESSSIQSILAVPLTIGDRFWGLIGVIDSHQLRQWSSHEESALFTLAANLGGAIHRQEVEAKIRYRASHDALTDLPNRRLFEEKLALHLEDLQRSPSQETLAIMFLDLDRFKTINDTLGHTIGDVLLHQVAERLAQSVRPQDIVARWGGDEFIILLPHITAKEEATAVAEQILRALNGAFMIEEDELYVSASIGIAFCDDTDCSTEILIQRSDIALYRVKEQGRNGYEIFDAVVDSKTPETLTIEKDLRHALERQELRVVYQPRINIRTCAIEGMEALIRWQHPKLGLISPAKFIPIAEEHGHIIPIGEWVLRKACRQNKVWQDAGFLPIRMAVNLSPKQFHQPNLVQMIGSILEETGLEACYLELEITETAAVDDIDFTSQTFTKLEAMGVELSIDDFGTGHSSLSRLQFLPLNHLKIDKSFVQDLTSNQKVAHIIATIVALGRSLGLSIVAEGVETTEQLDFLKSIDCETAQGYLFHRPISVEAATQLLTRRQDCDS
jgi:diguanylate cyclase (GGDEF)-like protein